MQSYSLNFALPYQTVSGIFIFGIFVSVAEALKEGNCTVLNKSSKFILYQPTSSDAPVTADCALHLIPLFAFSLWILLQQHVGNILLVWAASLHFHSTPISSSGFSCKNLKTAQSVYLTRQDFSQQKISPGHETVQGFFFSKYFSFISNWIVEC